jgi:hypothetical protein
MRVHFSGQIKAVLCSKPIQYDLLANEVGSFAPRAPAESAMQTKASQGQSVLLVLSIHQ